VTIFTPPPAATEFSVRTIGLEMRQAVFAICSQMIPTINDGPDLRGAPDLRGDLDHDGPDPHGEVIRGDRDRGLAR
jgi:hypothetical protein